MLSGGLAVGEWIIGETGLDGTEVKGVVGGVMVGWLNGVVL